MDDKKFAMTPKGVKFLIGVFLVIVSGFILMAVFVISDPSVVNT